MLNRMRMQMGMGITGLALVVLIAASPATAKNEFENGFKDELGRVAAHEAVGAGRQILAGILIGGPWVAPAPHREPAYGYDHPGAAYRYTPEPYGRTVVHRHDHYYHPVQYEYRSRGHGWGHHRNHHRHRGHDCDH